MSTSVQEVAITFNNNATKIYSNLFNRFTSSVRSISRKTDENVYKLQVAKFTDELRTQLQAEASKLITAEPQLQKELSPALLARINFYLEEFAHRCKSY